MCVVLTEARKVVGFPEAKVTGGSEPLDVGVGSRPRVLYKRACTFNCWTILPAPSRVLKSHGFSGI